MKALVAGLGLAGIALVVLSGPAAVDGGGGAGVSAMGAPAGDVSDLPPADVAGFEAQVATLRAQVEADPENGDLVLELATLLDAGHRSAEALPLYRRAAELGLSDPEVQAELEAFLATAGGGA